MYIWNLGRYRNEEEFSNTVHSHKKTEKVSIYLDNGKLSSML